MLFGTYVPRSTASGRAGERDGNHDTRELAELYEREVREVHNEGRLDVIDELYAPEFESGTTRAGAGTGTFGHPEALKSVLAEWDAAFPDLEMEVTTMLEDGDTVLAAWELKGTHEATFRGIEPTGREIDVNGFSYRRAEDDRYVAATDTVSMVNMLTQLGVDLPLQGLAGSSSPLTPEGYRPAPIRQPSGRTPP